MPKAGKGSEFERELAKRLSLWWTNGERNDIFWRTSQSGGRATQRSKKGETTFGSYGDLTAVDPIGAPLLKMFTIELKRGSSHGSPGDLLDFKPVNGSHPWVACLMQAIKSHQESGSKAWLLIHKRDHRLPIVYLESRILKWIQSPTSTPYTIMRMRLVVREVKEEQVYEQVNFVGLPLETFLDSVFPQQIIGKLKEAE